MEAYKTTIKAMVYGQLFVYALDEMRGSNHFKQQLKAKGNSFQKEVEKFLNTAYGGGNTDLTIIELLEHCQNKIDEIIENEVTFVE